ncbi:MAG: PhzF family phenazine biosynthesis protein, partial [Ktedonobacterales bacterium]|nr:PhzF family phenazine biosynthesis protein [Ktedonobacterales bacterium]
RTPFMGNGLAVFPDAGGLDAATMARITSEMRQFESIFLFPHGDDAVEARIFTMEEELVFAGHPILGAASVLHALRRPDAATGRWHLHLGTRVVTVQTERHPHWFSATMDQGRVTFGAVATPDYRAALLPALNLTVDDWPADLPMQVVTTGLPYLIVPVRRGLERARIMRQDFAALLAEVGAQFVYVVDVARREGRTWDNAGLVEDIATGSAAGPVGAYLVRYGLAPVEVDIILQQGRFMGRPSELRVRVHAAPQDGLWSEVSGDVCLVGSGTLSVPLVP